MVGQTISHYKILEELGAGGMGIVYRARDNNLQRDVALKVMQPDAFGDTSARNRFRKEALALSRVTHPNIAAVHEFDTQAGIDFLVMELIPGSSLCEQLASGPMPEKEVAALGMQIASALEEAHANGVVHRDLKPGNIILTPKGQVKVLDFGLAKLMRPVSETSSTASSADTQGIVGTFPYMAPEQLRGEPADARTDIHALGLVLYEMSSGRRPYAGKTGPELADAILHQIPVSPRAANSCLSPTLEQIILKCLEKDPENRYQSARELLVDLRRVTMIAATPSIPGREKAPQGLSRSRSVLLAGAALLLAAAAALWYLIPADSLTDKDVILIADFENTTGDSLFDGPMLKNALAFKLMESPFLNLYPAEDVRETLELMKRPADARIDEATGREICIRQGLKALVTGSIAALGKNYIIQLKAVAAESHTVLAVAQVEAGSKEDIVQQLGKAAADFRKKLGESLTSLQEYDVPLERATTSSMEALQALSAGIQLKEKGKFEEARSQFRRAIDFDPQFALAHAHLAYLYGNDNQMGLMREEATRAYQLRRRASERERLAIEFRYHASVTEDIRRAVEVAELLARAYPRDRENRNNLGLYYRTLGRYEEAIAEFREVMRLSPRATNSATNNIAWTYLFSNQFKQAQEYCDRALSADYDSAGAHQLRYILAAMREESTAMDRQIRAMAGKPQEYLASHWQGDFAAFSGRIRQARQFFEDAAQLAARRGLKDRIAVERSYASMIDAQVGACSNIGPKTDEALSLSREVSVLRNSADALAQCGRIERAEELAGEMARSRPQSTYVNDLLLPSFRAFVAILRGDHGRANALLQPLIPNDGIPYNARAIYLRGVAYLGMGEYKTAAEEFGKILNNRGRDPLSILYPIAQLQQARALQKGADAGGAREAYQKFFLLWKDADPDLPVLREARAEFGKLQ